MFKRFLRLAALLVAFSGIAHAEGPLRVFIRAGAKTHGPGQHDHPRFLEEWSTLLTQRGAKVTGGLDWPAPEAFDVLDVIVVFAPDPWDVTPALHDAINKFAERGGGFVVLHDGVCGHQDPDWVRSLLGGSWRYGQAKWFEGDISFYYLDHHDPITVGASNFDVRDEMYYQLDMQPEAKILAATWTPDPKAQQNGRAFPSIYDIAPQMWSYEHEASRAFVDLLGHNYDTFNLPQVRAVILRGLAWAGHREKVDEFCTQDELASLRYPPGGPSQTIKELAKFTLHPQFNISLAAAEPLINKPIALDWDARGRLWVAETPEYPNGRRGIRENAGDTAWKDHGSLVREPGLQNRRAHDRISVLIDSDGDGIADRKQVFYDGLELVTGFVLHRQGVIAAAAPDIWLLQDTTGSGKADQVVKLYTGLGTRDTHAVINNLRWGMDGWIYATHGYSSSDHVTSGDGSKDFGRIGSGVIRFKPDGSAIEQYSSKGGNTWGLTVTPDNEILWTQPTSGDLVMHTVLPESVLARGKAGDTTSYKIVTKSPKSYPLMTWEQQAYRQIDFVGSFTAAAGCAVYDGGTWPSRFNGNYFCTEPTINLVHHELLEPDGVSFSGHKEPGQEETEFVRSRDLWFRPIEVRTGPDGALYVLDFYNQAVIHNDTRGPAHNNVNAAVRPDRDHFFGRIWRLDHRDAKKLAVPDLSQANATHLVEALEHPNKPIRFTAQRLLVESGAEGAVGPLETLVASESRPATARLQALWVLYLTGHLQAATLGTALHEGDPAVVRNALKIAAEAPALAAANVAELQAATRSPEPRTQLAAILALAGNAPTPESAKAFAGLVPTLTDPFVLSAAMATASHFPQDYFAAALEEANGTLPLQQFVASLAATMSTQPEAAAKAVELLATRRTPSNLAVPALRALAKKGDAAQLAIPPWSAALQDALKTLMGDPAVAPAAVPLALAWDTQGTLATELKSITGQLLTELTGAATPIEERLRLVGTLVAARKLTPAIVPALGRLLGSDVPVPLQKEVLQQLGNIGEPETAALFIAAYPKLPSIPQGVAFSQILKRPEWTRSFVEGLKAGVLPLESLGPIALDKLRHYPDAATAEFAGQTLDALRGPVMAKKDDLIAKLLPEVEEGGDVEKGKQLFMSTCAICHKFNNQGASVAPDLTGMGAHPRAELLTDIVDPNREVDPSFIAYDFQTNAGESYQGIIASENAKTVLVRDAAGEHTLVKADLAGRRELGRSLMPEGFEALGAAQLRDIIAFLQSGDTRFRMVDLRKECTADSRHGIFGNPQQFSETLKFKRFGTIRAGEIPFSIIDPSSNPSGKNLIVLRGGQGNAKTYPQKVEIAVGHLQADTLEILGGVGGWAYPCCGDEKGDGLPAAKIVVTYEGGATEELTFTNGVEFADYARPHDVPGSKSAADLVSGQQVRIIKKPLQKPGIIEKLTLESFDNRVAPVFVAITAEKTSASQ